MTILPVGQSEIPDSSGYAHLKDDWAQGKLHPAPLTREDVDKIFTGENKDDYFAEYIATGDINKDNYSDVIVGAPGYDSFRGRFYIFYGGPDMDEKFDKILDGEIGHVGWFGRVLASGDINKDGYADLAITANHMYQQRGRVYLYYGGPDMDETPDKIFDGENALDLFGKSLALGKDVNSDSYGDLLIGSWDYPGNLDRGRAYLYYGGPRASMSDIAACIFDGESLNDRFGNEVAVGDINGDGFAEVVVGAWGYNDAQGRAYLFYGPFENKNDITLNWDTTNASIGKHTLKVEIPPVPGEQNTENNIKTVTIEVKEPRR